MKSFFVGLIFLSATGLAVSQVPNPKAIEAYPDRPVRVVVTTAPGGASDIIIRPLVQKLTESLKQPFFVDNKPGASGMIAMEYVAKAPPDGYTLVFGTIGTFTSNPAVYTKVTYDSLKSYSHVALIGKTYMTLAVSSNLPVKTLKEFVDYAKANPGKLTYGSFGTGSIAHLLGASFSEINGAQTVHVPYKGSLPAITALMAGEIDFIVDTLPSALPFIKQGRIKALGINSPERHEAAPEIPTFAEAGYPQFKTTPWWAIAFPANTPRPIVQKLNLAINEALKSPDLIESYRSKYLIPLGGTPEDLFKLVSGDLATQVEIAKNSNIRIDNTKN